MNSSSCRKTLLALVAIFLAGLTAASAQFTTTPVPGGVRITGYTGTVPANLVIPLQINGSAVLEIGLGAFQNNSTITTLTLPTSLTSIGANAFRDCDNLGSVFIPASVTSIGTGAFAACDRLASIQVDFTNGAYVAENGVLYDLVTSAGNAILHQYPAGRPGNSFAIPSNVSGIDVVAVADRAFEQAQNLLSMEFQNFVASIGANAFNGAPRLARVTFDTQVTSIGASSFNGTTSLAFATFLGNAPTTFGATVFSGASAGFEVRYLQGFMGFSAPTWTPAAGPTYNSRIIQTTGQFTYRASGTGIEILAPEPGLVSPVVIPPSIAGLPVRAIGNAAFIGDPLASVQFPESLNSIGISAFEGCSGLVSVTIPAGVSTIGSGAFVGCTSLLSFNVNPLNQNFSSSLDGVLFNKNQTILYTYPPARSTTQYTIPNTVQTIFDRAFEESQNLVTLSFPNSVNTIGNRAFYNSRRLVTVYFGTNINSIGQDAFSGIFSILNTAYFFGKSPSFVAPNAFPNSPQPFEVLYLEGSQGFPPSPGGNWNGYAAKPFNQFEDFLFTVLPNGTIEIAGYNGVPPTRGQPPRVRVDFTTLPDANSTQPDQLARLALTPADVDDGEYVFQIDTATLWVADIIEATQTQPARVSWSVVQTDGQQLNIRNDLALGSTVLVQNQSGPIVWQKVAYPGSNPSDWISVNFGIPNTIAGKAVTSIADNAFAGNALLASVVLPTSLTKIGANAFYDCDSLGNLSSFSGVFIPASVINIGSGAFSSCDVLSNLFVHPDSPNFFTRDGVLFNKAQTNLLSFPAGRPLVTYVIPGAVTQIAAQAFEGNKWLVTINLPDNVEFIGKKAFANSESLVQVIIGRGIKTIQDEAFKDVLVLGSAIFNGDAPTTIGANMFDGTAPVVIQYYNGFSGFTPTPSNWSGYTISPLSAIGDFVFALEGVAPNQTATVSGYRGTGGAVQIPARFGQTAVRKIADNAFLGKVGITSVTIPDSVSSIGEAAFKGVSTLASVRFGSGLTSIGKEAFYGCNELTEVSISAAVTSIGEAAFAACEKLIAIKVNPNNSNYRSTPYLNGAGEVLFDRTQKKLVQYPAGIRQSTYEIPATVETIGKRAFEGAVYLSVIEFPATVKRIETRAFYNTAALVTVRFGRGVTTIQDEAFAGIITPLNAAIFYGAAPTSFGTNVFQGALPTFEVRYLEGAQGFPAGAGGTWNGYKAVAIKEISEFEFRVIDNNTKIEITGYTGLAPTITADRSTLPTPNLVVPDRAARLALTDVNTQLNTRLPEGALVLQQDENLIWQINYSPVGVPIWTVYNNSGARFLLPSALPLGTVVLEQNGVSKVYYQKIGLPGAATSNWIVVDFRIPDTLSGLPVTSIADRAFENNSIIQSVVLPNSLTRIGVKAFAGCSKMGGLVSGNTLGGVFLPASVTTLGAGAFASCGLLQQIIAHPSNTVYSSTDGVLFNKRGTQIVQFPAGLASTTYLFPDAVTDIAASAFEGNAFLAELEFPGTIRTIGAEAFRGSKTLVSVIFNAGLASLGERAFASIPSLGEAIFFADSPSTVGANVFQGAAQDFTVLYVRGSKGFPSGASGFWNGYPAKAITQFNDFDFQIVAGGAEILSYLGDVSDIRFEADLSTLPRPNQIVTNAASREALPAGLPTGWNVLELSTNLLWFVESQTAATQNTPARNNWAVRVTAGDRLLLDPTVPVGTTFKEQSATAALFYQKVLMPGTNEADWIRISIRTLRIPETIAGLSVVAIAEEAFANTRMLESVVFPNSLKRIGDFAFKNCPRLGLPDGFSGDNRGVFIPNSVESIGIGVFSSCTGLSEIRVHPSNKFFSDIQGVLYNKAQTRLIQFPGGRFSQSYTVFSRATSIADYAFEGNANLESVVIPGACTEIGMGAFQGALSLTSVTVGNGVRRIGDLAFANIASLDSVTFQGNAPQLLGPDVFANRSSGFRILFNARSTGFSVEPWKSLPIQPVWLPSGPGDPPPASTGFRAVGYIDPAPFNNNIGGQIQLTVSKSRVASGVVMLGSNVTASGGFFPASASTSTPGAMASYRFRGQMQEDGQMSITIPRTGQSSLTLSAKLDLIQAPNFFKLTDNSVITDGIDPARVAAGSIPWSTTNPPLEYAGNYNIAFDADSGGQMLAPGYGFAGMGVNSRTGALRLSGVLGDGTRFTASSWVLGDGGIPIWSPLYNMKGMLVGDLALAPGGSSVDAALYWTKPPGVSRSPDPDGFDNVLISASPESGSYVTPDLRSPAWRDYRFTLSFDGEPASGAAFSQNFTVSNGRIVPDGENPNNIRATWNLRSGLLQGTFTIPDPAAPLGSRPTGPVGVFQGGILSNGSPQSFQVRGNFVLPNSSTRPTEYFGGSVSN